MSFQKHLMLLLAFCHLAFSLPVMYQGDFPYSQSGSGVGDVDVTLRYNPETGMGTIGQQQPYSSGYSPMSGYNPSALSGSDTSRGLTGSGINPSLYPSSGLTGSSMNSGIYPSSGLTGSSMNSGVYPLNGLTGSSMNSGIYPYGTRYKRSSGASKAENSPMRKKRSVSSESAIVSNVNTIQTVQNSPTLTSTLNAPANSRDFIFVHYPGKPAYMISAHEFSSPLSNGFLIHAIPEAMVKNEIESN